MKRHFQISGTFSTSLRTADVFQTYISVVPSFRRERSDDRKYVCSSQVDRCCEYFSPSFPCLNASWVFAVSSKFENEQRPLVSDGEIIVILDPMQKRLLD